MFHILQGKLFVFESQLFLGSAQDFWNGVLLQGAKAPVRVVTINVDHVNRMKIDMEYRQLLSGFQCATIDGAPVLWLARKILNRPWMRITGADLLASTSDLNTGHQLKVLILGGTSGRATKAASNLQGGSNNVFIGMDPGVITGNRLSGDVLNEIRRIGPDIIFVCLGSPKQEKVIDDLATFLDGGVLIGAGAAVDFTAGNVKRAPEVVQRLGFEWFWRLMQEPKRLWRRYLIEDVSFLGVIYQSLAGRCKSTP